MRWSAGTLHVAIVFLTEELRVSILQASFSVHAVILMQCGHTTTEGINVLTIASVSASKVQCVESKGI